MADARTRILFGQREMRKLSEREFWGLTLLGEAHARQPDVSQRLCLRPLSAMLSFSYCTQAGGPPSSLK